jgi:dTDP-D-glucose 4,6-dehydratase
MLVPAVAGFSAAILSFFAKDATDYELMCVDKLTYAGNLKT